jgi:hypothetical protein
MKTCVIVPTVRKFEEWKQYSDNFKKYKHDYDLLIIGEEENVNKDTMPEGEFWGVKERSNWFASKGLERFEDLIPKKHHAETSFGLLLAHERGYDMILFLDDDTLPFDDSDFIGTHWRNLNAKNTLTFKTENEWINAINPESFRFYPRGYPLNRRNECRVDKIENSNDGKIVINQGLWQNVPDLNAADYLKIKEKDLCVDYDFVCGKSNWITICSMNLAFRPEIIPAFYQLPMGEKSVDRYDDIWSGLFVKKVMDKLNRYVMNGNPLCNHNKYPRSITDDIRKEALGLSINELLYQALDKIELKHDSYGENYKQIANELTELMPETYREYFRFLSEKMNRWVELVDRIK